MCGSRDPHHFINTPLNPKPNLYVPGIESGVKLTFLHQPCWTGLLQLMQACGDGSGTEQHHDHVRLCSSCSLGATGPLNSLWGFTLLGQDTTIIQPVCLTEGFSSISGSTGPQSRTIRGCEELCEAARLTSEHHNKQPEEAMFLLSSSLSCTSITSITNTYYVTMATAVTMTFFKNNLMWHHQPFLSNCNLVLFSVHGHKLVRLSRVQTHEDSGQVWRLWDPHPLDCGKKLAQAWGQRAAPAQQEGRSFLRWGHGRGHYPLGGRGGLRVWLRFNYSIKCTLICHQHSGGATVTHSAFPRW